MERVKLACYREEFAIVLLYLHEMYAALRLDCSLRTVVLRDLLFRLEQQYRKWEFRRADKLYPLLLSQAEAVALHEQLQLTDRTDDRQRILAKLDRALADTRHRVQYFLQ